jgi:octaprenyl-diphosphate synthase
MVQLEDMDILRHMADTTNTIAEGEVLQLVRAGNPDTTEAEYLEVITRKTAILFAAACRGAATLSGANPATVDALHRFGLDLGIAFQMIDDVLDYAGDPATMGKNVGDDLTEGKVTLPLIHVLREGDAAQRETVRNAVLERSAQNIEAVVAAVQACGALEHTRLEACTYRDSALACLDVLPASTARDALAELAQLATDRDH